MANSIGGQVHVDGSSADLRNEQANSEDVRVSITRGDRDIERGDSADDSGSNQSSRVSQSRHKWLGRRPDAAGWMDGLSIGVYLAAMELNYLQINEDHFLLRIS